MQWNSHWSSGAPQVSPQVPFCGVNSYRNSKLEEQWFLGATRLAEDLDAQRSSADSPGVQVHSIQVWLTQPLWLGFMRTAFLFLCLLIVLPRLNLLEVAFFRFTSRVGFNMAAEASLPKGAHRKPGNIRAFAPIHWNFAAQEEKRLGHEFVWDRLVP